MGVNIRTMVSVFLAMGSASAFALEAPQVTGAWRLPGGSCDPAFYQGTEGAETSRGEWSVQGVVTNEGIEVVANVVVEGARRGQMISPETDTAVFLVEARPGELTLIPIGRPVLAWPEVTLEPCP